MRLYSPPFVIAPTRAATLSLQQRVREQHMQRVLLCGYCLSEDQRWLLAVCTDNRGELLETCTINIHIPNRNRRKKASARRIGLHKLWDFILSVLSTNVSPWRLVIGRFGRIGHGELMGWAGLLSRKNLQRASRQLRDMCGMCSLLQPDELYPCIQSACLVSMEMHGSIVVMPDTLKVEERQSSKCPLSTPRDASVTHILVMPTSATASVSLSPLILTVTLSLDALNSCSSTRLTVNDVHVRVKPVITGDLLFSFCYQSGHSGNDNQPHNDDVMDTNFGIEDDFMGIGIGGIDDMPNLDDIFQFDMTMIDSGGAYQ